MFTEYLWKKKWHIFGFILITVFSTVMMSLFSLRIADVFTAAEAFDYEGVLRLVLLMYIWYIFIRLVDYYAELFGVYIVNSIRRDIKYDMFDSLINRELPDFASRNSGEYIAEFTNDITIIETKYLIPLREILSYIITIVTVCSVIFTIDIRMTLVLAAGTMICLLLPILASGYTSSRMMRFLESFDGFVQYLKDVFNAYFLFRNFALEAEVSSQFKEENSTIEQKKYNAELALVVVNNVVGRIAWAIPMIVVVLGLQGVLRGSLAMGSVFSAYLLAGELGMPLQCIGHRIGMIRSLKPLEKKVAAMKKMKNSQPVTALSIPTADQLEIEYCGVGLSIEGKEILHGVNMKFEANKKYLILGRNGSGKSTALKLLKHFHKNYSGTITLNGSDLRSSEGKALSELISYSNETVSLLSDTVRNNILLFRDLTEEQLKAAVDKSGLNVPLERNVGDNGRFLSSGERRKLEIARALVSEPEVLIFDEVVSTLDIETAYEIEKLILSLDKTVIMISNAFSGQLLSRYDGIIVMDDGHPAAVGTHEELLKNCEAYRLLYSEEASAQPVSS